MCLAAHAGLIDQLERTNIPEEVPMDQVVRMIQDRAGINAEQARTAASTVVGFLKDKLPPPIASQVDGVLNDGDGGSSPMDQVGDMLGKRGER
jgi:hypothetical protein